MYSVLHHWRPTLSTWDSRDVLCNSFSSSVCVVSADQSLQNWDSGHLALPELKACCFLSFSLQRDAHGLPGRARIATKRFNTASLNCEAISQLTSLLLHLQLGENAPQVNRTALRAACFRGRYKSRPHTASSATAQVWSETHPRHYIFWGPFSMSSTFSPLPLL